MGDHADDLIFQGFEMMLEGDDFAGYTGDVTCKFCGKTGFEWVQTEVGWRLMKDLVVHECWKRDGFDPFKENKTMLRPTLQDFSLVMEEKLQEKDYKGGWEGMSVRELKMRLEEEIDELDEAIEAVDLREILDECVDVANFAMMIYNNVASKIDSLLGGMNEKT